MRNLLIVIGINTTFGEIVVLMKHPVKITLVLVFLLIHLVSFAQETAPEIVAQDCDGVSHNLFDELNDGKVIVIGWTMPCATCAAPLLSVHNTALEYEISHPGKVEYWVADDYAETSCQTVKDWSENNGISNATFFSTDSLDMYDFGSTGMPKVVVLGCENGKVYYNVNDFPNGQGAKTAIDDALKDINSGCKKASTHDVEGKEGSSVYPNPVTDQITIRMSEQTSNQVLTVEIVSAQGAIVKELDVENTSSPSVDVPVSDLTPGLYYARIIGSNDSEVISFKKQ